MLARNPHYTSQNAHDNRHRSERNTRGSPRASFVAQERTAKSIRSRTSDTAIVDPEAVNLLACHFIAHHRDQVVEFINRVAFCPDVLRRINGYVSDMLSINKLRFDVTGPLEPQNYFHCYEVRVMRALHRPDLVHADLALEYRNQLCITMDAVHHRGVIRGNSTFARVYRWVMPEFLHGDSPLTVKLSGHSKGVCMLRLTLQTSQGVAFPKCAHVQITDASSMQIKLDDYDIDFLGPAGHIVHFVAGQFPLNRLETVVNDAVQGVFERNKEGWPIAGGVQKQNVGAWSRRNFDGPWPAIQDSAVSSLD